MTLSRRNDYILFAIVMRQIDYRWVGGNVGGGNLALC